MYIFYIYNYALSAYSYQKKEKRLILQSWFKQKNVDIMSEYHFSAVNWAVIDNIIPNKYTQWTTCEYLFAYGQYNRVSCSCLMWWVCTHTEHTKLGFSLHLKSMELTVIALQPVSMNAELTVIALQPVSMNAVKQHKPLVVTPQDLVSLQHP